MFLTGSSMNLVWNPGAFVENLKYMGQGMLAIFVVIGVIIIATKIVSGISSKKDK